MNAGKPPVEAISFAEDIREEALIFAGVGLFRFQFDGTITEIDRSTIRILELDDRFAAPAEIIGSNICDLYTHIMPCGMLRDIISRNGRAHNLEYPLITLRGNRKWVLHNSFMVTDPATGVPYVQAIIHDITDNVQARKALWESEARFRFIFEDARIGILLLDLDGAIIESNGALQRMLGFTAQELARLPFERVGHPDDALVDRDQLRALLAGERHEYQAVKRFRRGDGRVVWGQLSFSLIRDAEGRPSFAIGVLEDTTAREESEQAKSQFLAVLTHELRTPLANIMGWAREAQDVPELAQDALAVILRNAASQSRMLNNLLEVSRLFYGRLTLRRETADLQQIAQTAITAMQGMAEARKIEISTQMASEPLPVFVDVKRVHEMICNLLDNACKFTPPGGRVTLSGVRKHHEIWLMVHDTGRGIGAEQIPLLFTSFPNAQGQHASCGLRLGLALVKSIVELHGGRITVQSDGIGKGSTFTVILPSA